MDVLSKYVKSYESRLIAEKQIKINRVKIILDLRLLGMSYTEIGHRFGISKQRARLIVKRHQKEMFQVTGVSSGSLAGLKREQFVEHDEDSLSGEDRLLTAAEIASILNISGRTVLRWTKSGKLPFKYSFDGRRYSWAEVKSILL